MARKPQIGVRLSPDKLAKLEEFAELTGLPLGTVCRQVLEEFAEVSGELGELIRSARRGKEAEALGEWAQEIVKRSAEQADQLRIPS